MSERPADAVVCDALRGGLVTRALALVADLWVAHALAGSPRSVAELARETLADADTLHRLLRALASDGVFAEEAPGVFRNTVASEVLTRDGWDDFAHLFGGIWLRAATAKDALKRLGLVSLGAVYQHFRDWPCELAAANITDAELARARAQKLPPPGRPNPQPGARSPSGSPAPTRGSERLPVDLRVYRCHPDTAGRPRRRATPAAPARRVCNAGWNGLTAR